MKLKKWSDRAPDPPQPLIGKIILVLLSILLRPAW
jgi:hypothetical protein